MPASQSRRAAARAGPDDLTGIDFRQLRYFLAVAEELHFGRAAARLFMTQPALSQAIGKLERTLGVRLLERTRHGVELTAAGTELRQHARRLLADAGRAVEQVRGAGRGEAGVLRVGVALLAEQEVAATLAAFHAHHPGVVLDRTAAVSERLLSQLRGGDLHAAFVHQLPALATAGLDWQVARRGQLAILAAQHSPLAGRASVTLAELSGQTFLVNPRELAPSAFQGLTVMCREYGGYDPQVLETASSMLLQGDDLQPILDGSAIAILTERAARASHHPGITAVTITPPPQFTLALAWRPGGRSAILARFLTFIQTRTDDHETHATGR